MQCHSWRAKIGYHLSLYCSSPPVRSFSPSTMISTNPSTLSLQHISTSAPSPIHKSLSVIPPLIIHNFRRITIPSQFRPVFLSPSPSSNQMIRQQEIRNPFLDLILVSTIRTYQSSLTYLRLE